MNVRPKLDQKITIRITNSSLLGIEHAADLQERTVADVVRRVLDKEFPPPEQELIVKG